MPRAPSTCHIATCSSLPPHGRMCHSTVVQGLLPLQPTKRTLHPGDKLSPRRHVHSDTTHFSTRSQPQRSCLYVLARDIDKTNTRCAKVHRQQLHVRSQCVDARRFSPSRLQPRLRATAPNTAASGGTCLPLPLPLALRLASVPACSSTSHSCCSISRFCTSCSCVSPASCDALSPRGPLSPASPPSRRDRHAITAAPYVTR